MAMNTDAIRAALGSRVGPQTPTPFGVLVPSPPHSPHHRHQPQQPQRQFSQTHHQHRQQHEQQQSALLEPQQQQQQQQPSSSVKDALISIRERLLSLQAKQQLHQDSITRQTMSVFNSCPSPVQQLLTAEEQQQQQQRQQQQQQRQQQEQPSPIHAVSINAQELERIQQQQLLLVSFLHKQLQLESQQQQQQQLQQQLQQQQQQQQQLQQQLLQQRHHQLLLQRRQNQQQQPQQKQQRHRGSAPQTPGGVVPSNNGSITEILSSSSSMQASSGDWKDSAAAGRWKNSSSGQGGEEDGSSSTADAAPANGRLPQRRRLQADDYTVLQMLKAAKLKPKVEGVCFDKSFKRWVAKKSGSKKVYFPVWKYGFDKAYELAVQTRRAHLQALRQLATGEAASSATPSPQHIKDELLGGPPSIVLNATQLNTETRNVADVTETQKNQQGGTAGSLLQRPQVQDVATCEERGVRQQALEAGGAGEETLRDGVHTPSSSPLDKREECLGDTAERASGASTASLGAGLMTQGPSLAEALQRLGSFRLDKLDAESPVNPVKSPKTAIRVAEALAPFPSGIRFDKTTCRWFALFRDKATGAKRAKTFTAKMYEGCVVKAYEACLRFCSCHVIKPIEGARPVLLDCTQSVALPNDAFLTWRNPADGDRVATPIRTPREGPDSQDVKWEKQQQMLGDDALYSKRRAYVASQMEALWQRSVRGATRRGTDGGSDGSGMKHNRALVASPSLGSEIASPSRFGAEHAPASPCLNNERESNTLALPPTDREDLSETNDLFEALLPGRSSRRRSRRIAGGKRRRLQLFRGDEGLFGGENEASCCNVSTVEQALMEGGRQYCQQSNVSPSFCQSKSVINSNGSYILCTCCSECENCSEQYQCNPLPFCLQCLPSDTRQMLRQGLLICFDELADLVLKRLNYSKTDRWKRWWAVRFHREKVAEAAVWQVDAQCVKGDPSDAPPTPSLSHAAAAHGGDLHVVEDTSTAGWRQQQQKQHECWGELIPYVHLLYPFIEHQEVPSNLDLCIVSDLLQQLHELAAKRSQTFKGYPLLSEAERYEGDFALSISERCFDDLNEVQQPFYTLGSGSPLYE